MEENCSKCLDSITRQQLIPYKPEQNSTAESINRTLLESACSIMYHANIPKEFQVEAMSTATYIRNRGPTRSLNNITPFEFLFNRKPDMSNLRVYGCCRKCIFVGYPDGTKGFKLNNLTNETFIPSRDVKLKERTFHEFTRQKPSERDFEFFYPPKEN